jgi:predicted Zn-dependent peptidase
MTQYRDSGYIYLYAGTNNEEGKIQKVVEEIYKELKDICEGGITEEEIEKMKKYIIEKSKMNDKEGDIFQYGEEYLLTGKITTRVEEYKKYEHFTKREIDEIIGDIIQWNKQKLVVLTDKKCRFMKGKKKEF